LTRPAQAEEIDPRILSSPVLLFLYYRVEKILGIKALPDALVKLNGFLEEKCGAGFSENPAGYERELSSRANLFTIADIVTINETYFFREGIQFGLLLRHFLPRLSKLSRPVRVCSAACSIGCEAYSIAMLFDFYAKKTRPFEYDIDAFDISAEAIGTAKNARYTANSLRTDGAEWKYVLDSHLTSDGGEFVVSREIRERVHFFTHNIMDGLHKQYDVIFFRNALIYFTQENRLSIMGTIAESLYHDGLLFLGVSETSSVRHPLLISRYLFDVFYFQKISPDFYANLENKPNRGADWVEPGRIAPSAETLIVPEAVSEKKVSAPARRPLSARETKPAAAIDCGDVAAVLQAEEGESNAKAVLEILEGGKVSEGPSASRLAAAAVFLLGVQNFPAADLVVSRLEKDDSSAVTKFLRGEYCFMNGASADAEKKFEEAANDDRAFWPAFYRIASLAASGNRTRYEYKLKKARESIELGKDMGYECFIGGFSPDYFRRILDKKLS
jgi:chemotaxis protein methyltransferase CheR